MSEHWKNKGVVYRWVDTLEHKLDNDASSTEPTEMEGDEALKN
jgi:hypothetical protein